MQAHSSISLFDLPHLTTSRDFDVLYPSAELVQSAVAPTDIVAERGCGVREASQLPPRISYSVLHLYLQCSLCIRIARSQQQSNTGN
jgi:hypothetical protein